MAERVQSLMLNCEELAADKEKWSAMLAVLDKDPETRGALIPQGRILITQYKEETPASKGA